MLGDEHFTTHRRTEAWHRAHVKRSICWFALRDLFTDAQRAREFGTSNIAQFHIKELPVHNEDDRSSESMQAHITTIVHGAVDASDAECIEMQRIATPPALSNADLNAASEAIRFEATLKPLSARHLTAINLLTMGKTVVAAARSLKICPSTIHRWKATNPLFIAELNRRQAALFDGMVVKLRLTMERAIDELHAVMTSDMRSQRSDTMWRLLPMLKPQRFIVPTGPTTATAVIDAQIRAERAEHGEVAEGEITNDQRLNFVPHEDRAMDSTSL